MVGVKLDFGELVGGVKFDFGILVDNGVGCVGGIFGI